MQGFAILLAEPGWFYEEQLRLQEARKRRQQKRKAKEHLEKIPSGSNKRMRTASSISPPAPIPKPISTQPQTTNTNTAARANISSPSHPNTSESTPRSIPLNILSPSRRHNQNLSPFSANHDGPIPAPVFTYTPCSHQLTASMVEPEKGM